jgi:hypothetical protein
MKIEKPRKSPLAKAGIKIRSGLRAGYLMGFTDMY